jgi:hypothetical protein
VRRGLQVSWPEDSMRGLSLGTPRGKVPDWLVFDGVMNEGLGFIR